jgi:predicted ATPase
MINERGAQQGPDGTLRYLLLVAALLSPRPPALFVLNEPESSLHPELLEPLASLIHAVAERAQLIVVTHSEALVGYLETAGESTIPSHVLELVKEDGETKVIGQRSIDEPSWRWPSR